MSDEDIAKHFPPRSAQSSRSVGELPRSQPVVVDNTNLVVIERAGDHDPHASSLRSTPQLVGSHNIPCCVSTGWPYDSCEFIYHLMKPALGPTHNACHGS